MFLLSLIAVNLSSVSRLFIARVHRRAASALVVVFSWITRSHWRTHMRYANSDIRICRSRAAPFGYVTLLLSSAGGARFIGNFMLPHPRMVPRLISGHRLFAWGHVSLARVHMWEDIPDLHCVRMCAIDSVIWHGWQVCLSS